VTLKSQPDESLDDLVGTQQYRQHCQGDVIVPPVDVAKRVDTYGADDDASDQISLRGKAHLTRH
jgi:hypothetical protein